ncbi:MAG: dephospho-CoA kinase [Cyclonatronaceae bacterium]
MITVGLTGGIGSGKTTVARYWEKLGAFVVYADNLAKELMVSDSSLKRDIKAVFGLQSYKNDGSLNREYLSQQAFDSGRVEELNALVHPVVHRKTAEMISHARAVGYPVFVKEAALLLKNGRPENLDCIVVVTAPEDLRIQRVSSRDNVGVNEVRSIIGKQQSEDEMISFADYTIENNKDMAHLEKQADHIYRLLQEKLANH